MIPNFKDYYVPLIKDFSVTAETMTNEQLTFLSELNANLSKIEKTVKTEALALIKAGDKRVASKTDWVKDYEIECKITFTISESDPAFDEYDDNILVHLTDGFNTRSNDRPNSWKWGIDDGKNHNIFEGWENHPMKNEIHCYSFHHLYDVSPNLFWSDILRIGSIWLDVTINYQNWEYGLMTSKDKYLQFIDNDDDIHQHETTSIGDQFLGFLPKNSTLYVNQDIGSGADTKYRVKVIHSSGTGIFSLLENVKLEASNWKLDDDLVSQIKSGLEKVKIIFVAYIDAKEGYSTTNELCDHLIG